MKHNWTRGMELPICIVCGLSPIAAHMWGDDDWKRYEIGDCPGFKLPHSTYGLLYRRRPFRPLVTALRWFASRHEAWLETVWSRLEREKFDVE